MIFKKGLIDFFFAVLKLSAVLPQVWEEFHLLTRSKQFFTATFPADCATD